jgi:hypothetical protein
MVKTASKKLLRSIPVNRRTPAPFREAIAADDAKAFQKAFNAEISRPLKHLRKLLQHEPLLALWSENTIDLNGRERELAASLDELMNRPKPKTERRKKKRPKSESPYEEIVENWLVESSGVLGPWETIVLAEILFRESHRLTAERFIAVLSVLASAISGESAGGLFDAIEKPSEIDDPVRQMIATGEAPWICSMLLSPLVVIPTCQKGAAESLQKIVLECSDADGIIHGSVLRRLPEFLAPLTRCSLWSTILDQPLWPDESQLRLAAIAERAAMLAVPLAHHSAEDSPEASAPSLVQILGLLLPVSKGSSERRLHRLLKECRQPAGEVRRLKKLKKKKPSVSESTSKSENAAPEKKKICTSWQSDSSCVAILRSGLDADADLLTLEWHSSDAQLQFVAAGIPILTGHWNWTVWLDDENVPAPSTWKCSCWFLDPEAIFVELEGEDSAPVKRVRQLLLAPHDRFAIMIDSVTSREADRKVRLATAVPLVDGTVCTPDSITRELTLTTGPRSVRTFPLWLEDDRVQHAMGALRESDGKLEMVGEGRGGVTLPLALDWHPKRSNAPADWARLTVTENRRVVGNSEASGFRIRIGDHQVMLYRSLMPGKNSRAVLGVHTWDESAYGRISAKGGQFESLVEVEPPE